MFQESASKTSAESAGSLLDQVSWLWPFAEEFPSDKDSFEQDGGGMRSRA